MKNFFSGWYVLYTKPKCEKKLAANLTSFDIEVYLPTICSVRKWNDRRKMLEMPLFPSYLFVYLGSFKDYYATLGAEGALFYIRFGKDIATVSDKVIRDMRALVDEGQNLEVSTDYFTPSEVVMIDEGPLAGLECEVVQHKDEEKILVRIQLLNRCLLVDVPVNHLVKV